MLEFHANGRNIVAPLCKRAQHCCALLRQSQNNRNVGTCWAKSLTGFKLYATSANIVVPCKRTQQVTTLLGPTVLGVVGQQCCVRLHGPLRINNAMFLLIRRHSQMELMWVQISRHKNQTCIYSCGRTENLQSDIVT